MAMFFIEPRGREGYFFVMKGNKGQVILTSEVYSKTISAYRAIRSIVANKLNDGNYQRVNTSDGRWYFVLSGEGGEVIGVSELFGSVGEMERMICLVKRAGKVQKIVICI